MSYNSYNVIIKYSVIYLLYSDLLLRKGDNLLKKQIIFLILPCLLALFGTWSYADITPVSDRTPEVRDAIVAAISDVDNAADVTEAHLATITGLNLRNKGITELKSGDFSGLTSLTNLNLFNNRLSSLPDTIFNGLAALTTLRLGSNTIDPLPLTVSLKKAGDGQFKAVVPAGAPFAIMVPITATNGSISDGTTTFTVTKGSIESSTVTVTRTAGTTAAVTATIGTLPSLPINHYGYTLIKDTGLPLEVISEVSTTTPVPDREDDEPEPIEPVTPAQNTAPTFTDGSSTVRSIAENTTVNRFIGTPVAATDANEDTLTYTLDGIDAASFAIDNTTGQLRTKAALDYEMRRVYILTITANDGNLTASISVIINVIDVADTPFVSTMLPVSERTEQVKNAIVAAVSGVDSADAITATQLSTITSLNLRRSGITELKSGDFGGLTALTSLNLYGNMLSSLPQGIFEGLTSLASLRLGGNLLDPMPITVSLEEDSLWVYRVVIPTGAPFDVVVPITNSIIMAKIPQGRVKSRLITLSDSLLSEPQGNTENEPFEIDASVAIGALPALPANHLGYILARSDVCNRTQQVSDAITAAVPKITDCRNVSEVQLAQIATLDLSGSSIISLAADDFDGLLSLSSLNLSNNQLTSLPDGIFASLPLLTALNLSGNTLDPLPISVILEKVGTNQVKAVVPTGAPFDMRLPIIVVNGSTSGSSVLIVQMGMTESETLLVTRASNTGTVTADFGTLPNLPSLNSGYALTKTNTQPLEIFSRINVAPVFTEGTAANRSIAENTDAGTNIGTAIAATDANNDTLTYTLGGTDTIGFDIDSTSGQLKTKSMLDYETKTSYSVTITVTDGSLTNTIAVTITVTDVDEVPPKEDEVVVTPDDDEEVVVTPDDDEDEVVVIPDDDEEVVVTPDDDEDEVVVIPDDDEEVVVTPDDDEDEVVVEDTPPQNNAPIFIDGNSTTRSVAENTNSGQNIGTPVRATDADGNTLTYTLSGTDAFSFSIDSSSGQLQTSAAIDYETKTSYSVTVSVSDGNDGTDTISVTINVTNVNEDIPNNEPVFTEGDSAIRSIAENTGSGVDIGTPVRATDADDDTLTYSLEAGDTSSFSIDSSSGQLRTGASLDYETKDTYSVTVSVSDANGGSDSISVTINITNVDETPTNNAPIFSDGDSTSRATAENTGSGVDIGSAVSATDPDGDTLTYTLSGNDAGSFSLDSSSGQLRTSASLDYETKTSYSVTLSVSDGNGGNDSIAVTINVTDIDESPTNNAPVFTDGSTTTRTIAENTAADTNIGGTITATDADNDTLTYTLSGTNASDFSIVNTSGQLKTKSALNHESKSSYSVTITASDGKGGSDNINVTISVTDVNEAPEFTDGTTTIRAIAENASANTNIGSVVRATDPDDGDSLTYTLGGTDAAVFSVENTTGQLKTRAALDYETKSSYSVVVTVSDGTLSDTITVTINITNLDETPTDTNRAPVFTDGETTTRSVAENTATGTNIGSAVSATDADNNRVAYTLSGNDASSFSIVSTTGQLQTNTALNHEEKSSYSVTVTVSDGTLQDTIAVTISVTDVNDAPVFVDDTATRSVAENTVSNTNLGSPIVATDPDGDDLTYTVGGDDAVSFDIDENTGQLKTKSALDFETKTSYSINIIASDGKLEDSISVTIKVTDIDENRAPAFTDGDETTRSVAENTGSGVNIGDPVSATDPDDDDLTYTVGGTDADSFNINSTNGQLRTKDALDYETKPSYSVTITVSDDKLSDSIAVTINVTNVDENRAPVFAGDSATRSVAENTGTGVNIGDVVSATDPDNDDLTYTLGGTDAASFDIGSTNGQLRTKDALDFEDKPSYTVTITASDGKLTDSITVSIKVTDVDENRAPVFTDGNSTTRSIAENTDAGTNIGSAVAATDADDDDLTYTLGGTDAASFDIVSTSGQIKTKSALDYETKASYTVAITASDGNLSDSITVTINVTDVDENNAPAFAFAITTRSVAENTASNTDIGDAVSATDEDDDTLTYTLGGTNASSFNIVSSSGQLKTKAALNYENKDAYSVTVSVSDGNGGTDSINVSINISDVNDPPKFTDGNSTSRSVEEGVETDTNIGTPIAATDEDGDTLTYSMTGDDADAFSIDEETGQLKTKESLDYETKNSYAFSVWVADAANTEVIIVTVKVTDVDENRAPVFSDDSTTLSVAENTRASTNIGNAITATDPDGDNLTYTLSGDDANSFSIVSTSGQLKTKSSLDYEDTNSYSVTVTASDGDLEDSINVTINVTDDTTENNPPVFSDGETTTRSIAENSDLGTSIGTPIVATDTDNDTLSYTISGTNAASFSLVSITGQLKTVASLDYEQKGSYSVTISVHDGNGGSDSIAVTINITNVHPEIAEQGGTNNAPVFTEGDSTTRSVPERTASGENIGDPVTATDADADTLTYTLSGTDAASFSIVSSTGQLQTSAALDYDIKTTYTVTVTVVDGESGTDTITVTINVENVNLISTRTQAVIDEIVERAIVESADDITTEHLQNITYMDLAVYTLTSLKAGDFDGLTGLEELLMDRNSLTSIPAGIFDELTSLERLTLWANNFTSFPDGLFDNLTNLEVLQIGSQSSTVQLTSGMFDNLTKLRVLSLSGSHLSSLPDDIFDELTSLTDLRLEHNNFTTFADDTFEDLTALVKLELGFNDITTLTSDVFSGLTNLERIHLYDNDFTTIPADIFESNTKLIFIEMFDNQLSSIPDNLFKGLSVLFGLDIRSKKVNPLPITASLEKVADGQFKVKVHSGAPLEVEFQLSVSNGSINGGSTRATIDVGSVESSTFTVTRTSGTTGAVTVDISTLPRKPYEYGYLGFEFVKSADLPLTVIAAGAAPVNTDSNPIPDQTALLSNYPNPFNPETWIPYQLANPTDVSLTIYNIRGVVVRQIALKQQPAGFYTTRNRALHWDGRNVVGEKVAGGVYFYQFKAGEYSALRKMLIVK